MFKHILQLFIGLLFLAEPLMAAGGSLYSRFGVGDVQYIVSPQAVGMGGAGLAAGSKRYINLQNPALLGVIDQTRIMGQVSFSSHALESSAGSAMQVDGNFNGTAFAVPINKFVLSVGLLPYSVLKYDQTETGLIDIPDGDQITYDSQFEGTGGLSTIPLAIGYQLINKPNIGSVYIGASYNFIFGTFEKTVLTEYSDISFDSGEKYERDNLNGSNYRLGLSYSSPVGIFAKNDQFHIGGYYSAKSTLNADREILISSTTSGTDTISTSEGNDLLIPSRFGLGLAYEPNKKLLVALDVQSQSWSDLVLFNDPTSYSKDALRIGGGVQYAQAYERRSSIFKKLTYRVGAYVLNHNIELQDQSINEYGLTFGIGIPLADGNSMVDIAMEYARKGTTDFGLIQEDIFRIKLSMSAGDTWFLERIIQ